MRSLLGGRAPDVPVRTDAGPGLHEVLAAWVVWGVVAAAVCITYARLPATEFYNVSGSGLLLGIARTLVFIGWPVSIAALAFLALACDRLLAGPLAPRTRRAVVALAWAAVVLCATIAGPGVVDQADLDAKPVNLLAAVGVAIALGLTLLAVRLRGAGPPARRTRRDTAATVLVGVLLVASLPWIFANLGVYVGDFPGLDRVFMSKRILPEPGHPHLRAVHLGNHEGLDGVLLAATALALRGACAAMRPTRLRPALGGFLALMTVYGLAVAANDGWNEQLVKRGTVATKLPSVLTPRASLAWLGLLIAAAVVYMAWFAVANEPGSASARA